MAVENLFPITRKFGSQPQQEQQQQQQTTVISVVATFFACN
jgi:hypothetical protein